MDVVIKNLREKRGHSTFPLQNNIDITLGHTAPLTSAFARPFNLDKTLVTLTLSIDL